MVHELGHFLAARACGVRVIEFSIGMGPALFKHKGKRTLYSIRLLPFGGYCAMEDEDGEANRPDTEQGGPGLPLDDQNVDAPFNTKPAWQRIIILSAGAAMNFILGLFILIMLFLPHDYYTTPTIGGFLEGYPSGGMILEGDEILSIDGERVYVYADIGTLLDRGDGLYDIKVRREGDTLTLSSVPLARRMYTYEATDDGGITTTETRQLYGFTFNRATLDIGGRISLAWRNALNFVRLVKLALIDMATGRAGIDELSGPVGITSMLSETAQTSLYSLWMMVALLTVNLAVCNLLPIPALDGGRILFIGVSKLYYLVRRKPMNPKYEGRVHLVGFVLLMSLMLYVSFNDIVRLFS